MIEVAFNESVIEFDLHSSNPHAVNIECHIKVWYFFTTTPLALDMSIVDGFVLSAVSSAIVNNPKFNR